MKNRFYSISIELIAAIIISSFYFWLLGNEEYRRILQQIFPFADGLKNNINLLLLLALSAAGYRLSSLFLKKRGVTTSLGDIIFFVIALCACLIGGFYVSLFSGYGFSGSLL